MWKYFMVLMFTVLLMAGCSAQPNEKAEEETTYYEPITYGGDPGIKRRGQIPTGEDSWFKRTAEEEFRNSKFKETNRGHDNAFNNEESMVIMEKVNELEEVTMTQAFTDDKKVYLAVMINPYDRRDQSIPKKVEAKVKEITDKPIIIYTNNNNWDHMKDLNARLKASQAPAQLKSEIREFFQQNQTGK